MPDQPPAEASGRARKLHFLRRNARNPLTFLRLLQKEPASMVIFNDFEQLTAPFWVPLYKALASQHTYAVILHDPDRDAYPPNKRASIQCMKALMSLMKLGLYHQHLPDKPYYSDPKTTYIDVPHGLYPAPAPDVPLADLLTQLRKPSLQYAAILGNIRAEKNYQLAIEALAQLPTLGLLIAGKASHQGVDVEAYKAQALAAGVADRIIWVERFLTEAEMAAVIDAADIILLYYARSFTSQSGILNTVAPMRKRLIASDGESSLALTLRRFGVGILAEPDSTVALTEALQSILENPQAPTQAWQDYLAYASWHNHVDIVVRAAAAANKSLGLKAG